VEKKLGMWQLKTDFLAEVTEFIERISEKKTAIDKARPLPTMAIERLKEELAIEWTYNSNSIEGNTLSLNETRVVLEEGMTIGGKSLREHFETLNHHKAIGYIQNLVSPEYELRAIDLLNLHEIVFKNIDDDFSGRIRTGTVRIMGANFTPPNPNLVSDLLDELIDYVNSNPDGLHPTIIATVFHHRFVWIHPFFDGNGRTVRLAMNLILQKFGFPPAIILKNDRKKYYSALNNANKGDYQKLALLMLQATERSLNIYLNLVPSAYQNYELLSNIVKEEEVPYGMEYVSYLARNGKINAYKEGRNWLSTKEDVLAYAKAQNKK
jgi:Fic family protein